MLLFLFYENIFPVYITSIFESFCLDKHNAWHLNYSFIQMKGMRSAKICVKWCILENSGNERARVDCTGHPISVATSTGDVKKP